MFIGDAISKYEVCTLSIVRCVCGEEYVEHTDNECSIG